MDVWRALEQLPEYGSEAAKGIYARQGGCRLSEIESMAVRRLVRELMLKSKLSCDLSKCSVRRQKPSGVHKLPWHQDYAPMQLQPGCPGIVAWVPLDPIDGSRPSLEIAPSEEPLSHYCDDRNFLVSDDAAERTGSVTVSDLDPGDVVMFSPYEPHRTYCTPDMTSERLSLDLRFQ